MAAVIEHPHLLNSVAALPCEIRVFNCTTLQQSYSIQLLYKLFWYSKCIAGMLSFHWLVQVHVHAKCSKCHPWLAHTGAVRSAGQLMRLLFCQM